jgi:hypothetical protein
MRAALYLNIFFSITFFLSGCATKQAPSYSDISVSEVQETSKSISPTELVERTSALFSQAPNLGLEFYSPSYYQEAVTAIEVARSQLEKDAANKGDAAIRPAIAAQKFLEKAQLVRSSVERNLKDLIKHRNLLVEIGAPQWQPKDYEQVSSEIKELTSLIEREQVSTAIAKEPSVREGMYTLEINTILVSALDAANATLAKAKNHEAASYAAGLYNEADILIDDTKIYIKANYRDRKGIQERADKAQQVAETALKYAIDAQEIFALDKSQVEAYLSSYHKLLDELRAQITSKTLPPLTISQTLVELKEILQNQKKDLDAASQVSSQSTEEKESDYANADENLEVLKVLDSLDLDSQSSPIYEDEQSFDNIEYVE